MNITFNIISLQPDFQDKHCKSINQSSDQSINPQKIPEQGFMDNLQMKTVQLQNANALRKKHSLPNRLADFGNNNYTIKQRGIRGMGELQIFADIYRLGEISGSSLP